MKFARFRRTGRPKRKSAYDEKKLWPAFSTYIRLRDSDENGIVSCITCGLKRHWRDVDCGHGIPRQHKATKYDERNNGGQCKRCNGFEGGKREVFKQRVDEKYGAGTWSLLEVLSRSTCKRTQFEIDIMTEHYKKLAQAEAEKRGITL